MKNAWIPVAVVCALVIGVYACAAHSRLLASTSLNAADTCYNLLVQGFRAGQLSLKKEVPPGLAQLADPYDQTASAPYGVLDLSYYKRKFYLYFGITPAVVLFWPYVALTGHYLSERAAAVIFCVVGFLVSVGLLCALWRRYFAEVSVAVVAAGTLALGLATFIPSLLARCDVYEVAVSCGYALTMLALAAVWKALHESRKRSGWLAAASLAYGLAVGARPSLLFGAVILLVPVVQARREGRRIWLSLVAATVPIAIIGLGLMLYNVQRFDDPLEFGIHYQMTTRSHLHEQQLFSLRYFWFNFRVYFLEPARWSAPFPFVHEIRVPPMPAGYFGAPDPFGILTSIPLVWLALAAPLAWRGRTGQARSVLRWFVIAVALLFGICSLTLGLYCYSAVRYEVEFVAALVLLAVVGILGLECWLAPTSGSGQATRPIWRRAVRCGWGLLLGFSVVFNLLLSAESWAYAGCALGTVLTEEGRVSEGIEVLQKALRIKPDYADGQQELGTALLLAGRAGDAIRPLEQALRIKPDLAVAHYNLGVALEQAGQVQEAIQHYEQALRIKPDYAAAHNGLGLALVQTGNVPEAIGQYEQALRIKPDLAAAHYNLGIALRRQGRLQEAIGHYEQALRLKADYAEAHYNLGNALLQAGKVQEAIGHYEQALRLKPDYAAAHYNWGVALEQAGRVQEAIQHYEQALRISPDFVEAQNALARAQAGQ